MLQFMESRRVRHNWETKQHHHFNSTMYSPGIFSNVCRHFWLSQYPEIHRAAPDNKNYLVQVRSSEVQKFRSSGVPLNSSSAAPKPSEPLNSSSAAPEPRSPLRTGIRFHRGTKPQHSTGCILVPADKEKQLTDLILKTQNNHEEILLEVIDYSPGTQYGYDNPCPSSELA